MTEEQKQMATELALNPSFRRRPGMLMRSGRESVRLHGDDEGVIVRRGPPLRYEAHYHLKAAVLPSSVEPWIPDLSDPATLFLCGLVEGLQR